MTAASNDKHSIETNNLPDILKRAAQTDSAAGDDALRNNITAAYVPG
jgi:hypothetical protein